MKITLAASEDGLEATGKEGFSVIDVTPVSHPAITKVLG